MFFEKNFPYNFSFKKQMKQYPREKKTGILLSRSLLNQAGVGEILTVESIVM